MKKLIVLALGFMALIAADASAYYGRYNRYNYGYDAGCGYNSCKPKCCPKVCAPKCAPIRVEEEPRPAPKCCVRYVRVEEPCLWTKHISWSCECPSTCQVEGLKNYEVEYADAGHEAAGVVKTY